MRFVGTARGLETRLVPEAGFALELIRRWAVEGREPSYAGTDCLGDLPLRWRGAGACCESFEAEVVVGVGGYASGPAMAAAIADEGSDAGV